MAIGTQTSPLVILGFDAADLDFIDRWTQEGYLPTLASVMKRGSWGRITGQEMICEHGTWLSLLSGISHSQHGYYFRQLKPYTYDLQAFTAREADALPFWSYWRGRDKRVAIIDAPDSDLVAGLQGIQLANWAIHQAAISVLPACAEPARLLQDARQSFGPQMPVLEFKPDSNLHEDCQLYHRLLERIEKKGALCRNLLARGRFDLIVVGFFESHTAGHRFWKYRPEARDTDAVAEEHELTHAIRDVYQAIDQQMGLLLAQLPSEANVFIISPFGMEDQYPTTGLMEAFCRQLGYQAAPKPASLSPGPLAFLRRMLPEAWRIALSHHLALTIQERVLADQFRTGTDWQQTTAFAIPSLYTSFVRINLMGREPQGIVAPGAEYEAILDQLETDLQQLVDPQTGGPAVEQVTRTVEVFHCNPPASLPDLFVEWQPGFHFMERVVHSRAELVQPKQRYHRESYHSFNGVVAAAGPAIRERGAIGDVSPLDLAPTFLSLLGEPIPERLVGQVIRALIRG